MFWHVAKTVDIWIAAPAGADGWDPAAAAPPPAVVPAAAGWEEGSAPAPTGWQ